MAVRGEFACPSAGRFSGRLWGVSHGRRHKAVVFNIKGPSWRMREHSALAEASKA